MEQSKEWAQQWQADALLAQLSAWDSNGDILVLFATFSSRVAGEEKRGSNSVHGDFVVNRVARHSV